MLFPIDQIGNKAELSNVIKNKGLNEPSLAMGRIPLPNRMNFFFDPPSPLEFEACGNYIAGFGSLSQRSFDPCYWYFVMELTSLQGDYNGEEIAKVMELVELEEAEKKRQRGGEDLLG